MEFVSEIQSEVTFIYSRSGQPGKETNVWIAVSGSRRAWRDSLGGGYKYKFVCQKSSSIQLSHRHYIHLDDFSCT